MTDTKHICDVCGKAMGINELGYLGAPLRKNRRKKHKGKVETLCHEHHENKLNQMGLNPNTLSYDDPRASRYGASFGMGYQTPF